MPQGRLHMRAHLEGLLANGGGGAAMAKVRLRHDRHVRHRQLQGAAALLLGDEARHGAVHLQYRVGGSTTQYRWVGLLQGWGQHRAVHLRYA